ncbi:hypothetical protein FHG87_019174 [Trinorchestia longiramus]|nr:hypothetical protein FHG87_019174 [Trinorchestia longiramus]
MAGFEPAVFLHEAETRDRTRAADHSTTVAAAQKKFGCRVGARTRSLCSINIGLNRNYFIDVWSWNVVSMNRSERASWMWSMSNVEKTSGMQGVLKRTLGMRYLVGLDEECNMTVVDAMKDFLVYAWNKRQGC